MLVFNVKDAKRSKLAITFLLACHVWLGALGVSTFWFCQYNLMSGHFS
jgi:hypothetical protein